MSLDCFWRAQPSSSLTQAIFNTLMWIHSFASMRTDWFITDRNAALVCCRHWYNLLTLWSFLWVTSDRADTGCSQFQTRHSDPCSMCKTAWVFTFSVSQEPTHKLRTAKWTFYFQVVTADRYRQRKLILNGFYFFNTNIQFN